MLDGKLVEVRIREKAGALPLDNRDKPTAIAFIEKYHKNIIEKWIRFFVYKQRIRNTSIKKKL